MTEEVTTPATEEPTPEAQPEAPSVTDEAIAEALGVTVEFLKDEIRPNAKNFDKMYSKLNAKAMELATKSKEAPAAPAEQPADDEDYEFDAKARKALKKFIESEFGSVFSLVTDTATDAIGQVIEDFSEAHKDLDAARVQEVMDENKWWDRKPSALKRNLERAAKLVKAEAFDPEAEAERIAEERVAKILEEKGLKDADVVFVNKSPKPENVDSADWKDERYSPDERFALLRAKQASK